jgi:hypothetical protein
VVLFVVVVVVASITPAMHLKSDPPADFAALRASGKAPNAVLAGEYWDAAVKVIQWKYPRTTFLPEQIPGDFKLEGNGRTVKGDDPGVRAAYWAKLRQEWLDAQNWKTTYSIDWSWPFRDVAFAVRELMTFFRNHDVI